MILMIHPCQTQTWSQPLCHKCDQNWYSAKWYRGCQDQSHTMSRNAVHLILIGTVIVNHFWLFSFIEFDHFTHLYNRNSCNINNHNKKDTTRTNQIILHQHKSSSSRSRNNKNNTTAAAAAIKTATQQQPPQQQQHQQHIDKVTLILAACIGSNVSEVQCVEQK